MNTRKARAIIAIGADDRQLDKDLAAARKKLRAFRDGARKIGGKLFKGAGGLAKGALGALGGGLGIEAAGGLTDMVSDLVGFEKNLTRFQIASGKSNAEMVSLKASILSVSKATAVSSADILEGAQTYVDLTGDVKGAVSAMRSFARVAQASGASVSDVATATAAMQMSGKLAAEDIEAVWSGLIAQGKAGAVSVKDMAGELSTLMPMMAQFRGGTGAGGIRDMGAAFQVVRRGAGSAAEASTKLQSLVGSLIKNSAKLRKAGINVFTKNAKTGKRELIEFRDIVGQIAKKGMDAEKLSKVIGTDKESLQAINMLTKELALYDELKKAGEDTGSVERDLTTFLESPAGRLEKLFATLKATISEAFTPERIAAFVDAMSQLLDLTVAIVRGLGEMAQAVDAEGLAAKTIAKRKVGQSMLLGESSAQKRSRADELVKQASAIKGDDMQANAVRSGYLMAAEELRKRADQWFVHGAGEQDIARFDPVAFQAALIGAIAKAPIAVKTDSSVVAKTVANAPNHRRSPRVM
jgi:TP901 family phage tail tape measure protein